MRRRERNSECTPKQGKRERQGLARGVGGREKLEEQGRIEQGTGEERTTWDNSVWETEEDGINKSRGEEDK